MVKRISLSTAIAAALFTEHVFGIRTVVLGQAVPPAAERIPHRLDHRGDVRIDNYYWLRERENPKVLEYLQAENRYYETATAHTKLLREKLYEEIKGRVKETDISVPVRRRDFVYFTRTKEGKQYPIHCRHKVDDESSEQVTLDVNAVAEGNQYCSVRTGDVSFGQDILPYAVDTVGRNFYTVHFKNLTTNEVLPDVIADVTGNVAWANDNRTLFYTKQHPQTLRPYQVHRHVLGTDPREDQLVYEERDDTFTTYVFKSRSEKYVIIGSHQTLSNEFRYVDADKPTGRFNVFLPRRRNHEYDLNHHGGKFYVRTNRNAKNFRLMSTPDTDTAEDNWTDVVPPRDDVYLESYTLFDNYLVVQERKDGLTHLQIQPWSGEGGHDLQFDEPAYVVFAHANPQPDTVVLRFGYSSLTTPPTVYDYDMATRQKTLLKREEVLGDFDAENYRTERIHATARDGARIPVSLVYRRQLRQPGKNPLLLYGYGSYGMSMSPFFRSEQLSLLDRGFVYAIAHIRGGQELGREWYDLGKLMKKKNTFTDFIDVADHLVEAGYADPGRVYAMGGSAGGLLMGAVANMRPERFRGIIAHVPFVDVLTTMLDESIPLTTNEYDEWGNPNEKPSYDYIRSYSPYDNVVSQEYPRMLVTTGLHDSQVQYWEPAKWVAKLRELKTDKNPLLFKIEMEAGHSGPTGRYRGYRETAIWWAFLLDSEGITE
jgi:oligopeptidase B